MYKKLSSCKYCSHPFGDMTTSQRANHSRWCADNPKRPEYVKTNSGSQMNTPSIVSKRTESIKAAWKNGKYDGVVFKPNGGTPHTEESKKLLREKALKSTHRRLIRSVRDYVKLDGTVVQLDSSWEERLARRLDYLRVNWIRPPSMKYIDKHGLERNYFPDFYLTEYDVYLDPKNPYAIKAQQDKLDCLKIQLTNLIILKTVDECDNFTVDIINLLKVNNVV